MNVASAGSTARIGVNTFRIGPKMIAERLATIADVQTDAVRLGISMQLLVRNSLIIAFSLRYCQSLDYVM